MLSWYYQMWYSFSGIWGIKSTMPTRRPKSKSTATDFGVGCTGLANGQHDPHVILLLIP